MTLKPAVILISSLTLYFTYALGIDDSQYQQALQICLKGRCNWGENSPGKLPPYDLGTGYICDNVRIRSYDRCMDKRSDSLECLKLANIEWESCFDKPCPHLHQYCLQTKCTKSTNSWDCWRRKANGTLEFGFETFYDDGTKTFIPIAGKNVPDDKWEAHCKRINNRCEKSMKSPKQEVTLPVSDSFCSAKCTGHNCHHAVVEVCKCLKEKGVHSIKVVVFDEEGRKHPLPPQPGNVGHSILTIPHPSSIKRDLGYRCVLESQIGCHTGVIPDACCYRTKEEFENLSETTCPMATSGPLKKKNSFKGITEYKECDGFLLQRGTCRPDTVPRIQLRNADSLRDH